ncbi:MAG: Trm112 family protein [Pseudomonadota bacterium]
MSQNSFDRHMLDGLVCPVSQGVLNYDAERQELVSKAGKVAFPIRDGIPIMLIDEARSLETD